MIFRMLSSSSLAAFSTGLNTGGTGAPAHPGGAHPIRPVHPARSSIGGSAAPTQGPSPVQAAPSSGAPSSGAPQSGRPLPRGSLVDLAV